MFCPSTSLSFKYILVCKLFSSGFNVLSTSLSFKYILVYKLLSSGFYVL